MGRITAMALPNNRLRLDAAGLRGTRVLAALLELAANSLQRAAATLKAERFAAVSRLRGTGRGIHFGDLVTELDRQHPIKLVSPFEDSNLVAGAVWDGNVLVGGNCKAALAKLRWSAGADDLPMHVHDFSDRFIIVHEGRGFFHVSDQRFEDFDGSDVKSIPARERDVFLFSRGVVHTFSTLDQPMTLLSCQLPYLPFDDPDQFRIPKRRWIARENPEPTPPSVACDPAWTVLTQPQKIKIESVFMEVLRSVPPQA